MVQPKLVKKNFCHFFLTNLAIKIALGFYFRQNLILLANIANNELAYTLIRVFIKSSNILVSIS